MDSIDREPHRISQEFARRYARNIVLGQEKGLEGLHVTTKSNAERPGSDMSRSINLDITDR